MKCSNCGNEMVRSRAGWLCLSCGHLERDSKSASATGTKAAARKPEPEKEDKPEPEPEPAAEPEPEPAPAPEPEPEAESASEPEKPKSISSVAPPWAGPAAETAPKTPLNGKPPLKPVTHPRPHHWGRTLAIIAGFIVVLLGIGVAYLVFATPKMALGSYAKRLSQAKTSTIALTVDSTGSDNRYALKAKSKIDLTNPDKPKAELTASGDTNSIYDAAKTSLGQCFNSSKALSSALANAAGVQNPVSSAAFAGLDTINGAKTLHYRGSLDAGKLNVLLATAAKDLSAACKPDVHNFTVTYDLWRGWSSDRLKFRLIDTAAGTNIQFVIDSGSYDAPVDIKTPATASPSPSATPTPSASPSPSATPAASSAAAHDAQRKADLAAYVAAYRATAQGGYYQTNPPAVSVNAKDPTTGAAYVINRAAAPALGHIEYRAGGRCGAPDITPGSGSTHYIALHTMLEGQADYCLEVK